MNVRTLLTSHNIRPRKGLGQCFLDDPYYVDAILTAAHIEPNDTVLEIGPGPGILTRGLIERAGRVIAIEFDAAMIDILRTEGLADKCTLIPRDVLRVDWKDVVDSHHIAGPPVVVGNLPYGIATEIIHRLLDARDIFRSLYVTVQREVADRLTAGPGGKSYGALSVLCQACADLEVLVDIPPEAFYPRPAVHSAMVGIHPADLGRYGIADFERFRHIVRTGFAQRRKTLANALAALSPTITRGNIVDACARAGISAGARAEELSVRDWSALTGAIGD